VKANILLGAVIRQRVWRRSCCNRSQPEAAMARCEVCGNDYERTFQVIMSGATRTFDSFECAIHALAPACKHCGCKIVGHGIESKGTFYCCAHCAEHSGVKGAVDNTEHAKSR
jgi:hypothetical protein